MRGSLLAAPLLVAAALAAYGVSEVRLHIGPLDRAQVGWFVVMPLYLISPGVLGLAWRSPGTRRWARSESVLIGVALGILLVIGLALTVRQLGCQPVTSPLDVLPRAIPGGLAAALGFVIPTYLAGWVAQRRSAAVSVLVGGVTAFVALWVTLWAVVLAEAGGVFCNPPL